MKHFRTNDFLDAIRELLRTHSLQYAESCARSTFRAGLVSFQVLTEALRILKNAA